MVANFLFHENNFIFVIFLSKYSFICSISGETSSYSRKVLNISDNLGPDAFIGHLPLTVKEAIESYQLLFGRSAFRNLVKYFHLNNKGEIKTLNSIDRDDEKNICGPLQCCKKMLCKINFEVIFSPLQSAGFKILQTRIVEVLLNIIDENDNDPIFQRQKYDVSIIESNNTPSITLPKAVDKDSMENGVKHYSIDNTYNNLFSIYIDNEIPMLNISRPIDYEDVSQRLFNFILYATDDLKNELKCKTNIFLHIIDDNDNFPIFINSEKTIKIFENISKNSIIHQFHAIDKDSNDNSIVKYSLSPLSEPKSILEKFQLNTKNGKLKVIKNLDYENFIDRNFKIVVTATDGGKLALSSSTTLLLKVIDVNDHPPELIVHLNNSIIENEPLGKIVLSFSFIDRDEVSKNQLKCDFVKSLGLSIDSIENEIYQIVTNRIFDAETYKVAWIDIKCVDNVEPVIEKKFHLTIPITDINDNYPKFEKDKYFMNVEENIPIGTPILKVTAIDYDRTDAYNLRYVILDCNIFNIDIKSGVIYTRQEIDREEIDKFSFTIQVSDSGQKSNKSYVYVTVLDINDNAPQASTLLTYQVVENASIDFTIAELLFTDKDKSENGTFSFKDFEIMSENPFKLLDSGKIILLHPLDREKQDRYLLPFIVYDHGEILSLSTTATATIHIEDINDNIPIFIYPSNNTKLGLMNPIYHDSPSKTTIITLRASDFDVNDNNKLRYKLEKTNASNFININGETAEIYFFYHYNQPRPGLYEIKATVFDNGNPPLSSVVCFFMVLSNENFPHRQSNRIMNNQKNFFSNIVIFSLIIVFSTALISTLVAVVVWVRSKQSNHMAESPDLCNYISMHEEDIVHNRNSNNRNVHDITQDHLQKFQKHKDENIDSLNPSPDLIFIDHILNPSTSDYNVTLCKVPQAINSCKLLSKSYNTLQSPDAHYIASTIPLCSQDSCILLQSQSLINENPIQSTTRTALLERRYPNFRSFYSDNEC